LSLFLYLLSLHTVFSDGTSPIGVKYGTSCRQLPRQVLRNFGGNTPMDGTMALFLSMALYGGLFSVILSAVMVNKDDDKDT